MTTESPLFGGLKEGFITRRGGRFKSWKKRYFVLTSNSILYFVNAEDELPKGTIPLASFLALESVIDSSEAKKPFCFGIKTDTRTYYISCDNSLEQQKWMRSIGTVGSIFADSKKVEETNPTGNNSTVTPSITAMNLSASTAQQLQIRQSFSNALKSSKQIDPKELRQEYRRNIIVSTSKLLGKCSELNEIIKVITIKREVANTKEILSVKEELGESAIKIAEFSMRILLEPSNYYLLDSLVKTGYTIHETIAKFDILIPATHQKRKTIIIFCNTIRDLVIEVAGRAPTCPSDEINAFVGPIQLELLRLVHNMRATDDALEKLNSLFNLVEQWGKDSSKYLVPELSKKLLNELTELVKTHKDFLQKLEKYCTRSDLRTRDDVENCRLSYNDRLKKLHLAMEDVFGKEEVALRFSSSNSEKSFLSLVARFNARASALRAVKPEEDTFINDTKPDFTSMPYMTKSDVSINDEQSNQL